MAHGVDKSAVPLPAIGCGLVWMLLIAGLVPWRQGDYFSGGLDPVVIAKGLIQLIALFLSIAFLKKTRIRNPIAGFPFILYGLFIAFSIIGALASGSLMASAILSVRLILLIVTLLMLVQAFTPYVLIKSIVVTMLMVGVLAGLTGLKNYSAGGRLGSTFPPLSPNEISMLVGLPALAFFHEIVHGRGNKWIVGGICIAGAMLVATGSRTSLLAFCIAAVIILMHLRRLTRPVAATFILLIPAVFALFAYTSIVNQVAVRSSGGSNATLNSRTFAWDAVLSTPVDTWRFWLGSGLSVKTVPVVGQYWQNQVLDSTWISALAQSGVLGTAVLFILCMQAVRSSLRSASLRSFITAALIFILIRSVLENGLTESSTAFMMFFMLILLVGRPRADARHDLLAPARDRKESSKGRRGLSLVGKLWSD